MLNKLWKFTLSLSVIGILLLTIVFILTTNVDFILIGNTNINIKLNENYIEEGYIATIFKKDISNKVSITNNFNSSIIGNYTIEYNLSFLGKKYKLNRTITVIDDEIPMINLNGEEEITLYINQTYHEEGAYAFDNYDKDITNQIKIESNLDTTKEGDYQIIYSVRDSSGNENSITRKISVKKNTIYNPNIYRPDDTIVRYIKENNYNVSIGYYNLITGEEYYYQENKIYYGASLIKTLEAIYLYDNNLVTEELKPYIKKAISISDNDAHYYLLNRIGKNNLKNYGIALGALNTLTGTTDSYGNTTVRDQIIYLKKLYNLSKNNYELKSYFINDYGNYLKFNDLTIMHKYGYYGQYYHDVGIVLEDNPYVIVILTNHGNSNKKEVINNLSKLMYSYHKKEI
ncbi:MAG: immunoglobulin-like domain-containing protein [Bacilli bacterium]